jgi:hypothetical protein
MELPIATWTSRNEYEKHLENLCCVQRCAGCNKPLQARPYAVVGWDDYVCSEDCLTRAQEDEAVEKT